MARSKGSKIELTRDEAIIIMVESNLQRSTILPSEKAFASPPKRGVGRSNRLRDARH